MTASYLYYVASPHSSSPDLPPLPPPVTIRGPSAAVSQDMEVVVHTLASLLQATANVTEATKANFDPSLVGVLVRTAVGKERLVRLVEDLMIMGLTDD